LGTVGVSHSLSFAAYSTGGGKLDNYCKSVIFVESLNGFTAFSLPGQGNRTLANSLYGTFAPGPFVHGLICSSALSLPGTFDPSCEMAWIHSMLVHDIDL